ncbi:MAG: hypothetical protein ACRD4P_04690, partial [Bryobacteraceae bacterium]
MRRLALSAMFAFALLHAQATQAQTKQLDVQAGDWVDTGIDLRVDDVAVITATGTITVAQGRSTGPAGLSRGFRDLLKAYPVNEAGLGALIGRIGSSDAAVPFPIGEAKRLEAPRAGRLFLAVNKSGNDSADGTFHVTVEFQSRGSEKPVSIDGLKLPTITKEIVDRI